MLQEFVGDGERGVRFPVTSLPTWSVLPIASWALMRGGLSSTHRAKPLPIPRVLRIARLARWRQILECVPGARVVKREFSCDVLVPNRFEFAQAFPEVACDRANVGDYLHFMLKGGR